MADPTNALSPEEQKFFETGELPAGLKPVDDGTLDNEPEDAAAVAARLAGNQPNNESATAEPSPTPNNDMLEFLRASLVTEQRARADLEAQLRLNAQKTVDTNKPQAPDPTTDPIGYMMHQLNTVGGAVVELQTKLTEQSQNQQNLQQLQNFQTAIKNVRDEFTKGAPDFPKAYDHLRKVQADDMRGLGYSETEINEALVRGEINVAQTAMRNGKNPAQVIYEMAKRHGYTGAATGKGNDGKPNLTEKLKDIQNGMKTGKQPAAASPPQGALTVEGLKNASESDLDALVRDPKTWGQITGAPSKDIFS